MNFLFRLLTIEVIIVSIAMASRDSNCIERRNCHENQPVRLKPIKKKAVDSIRNEESLGNINIANLTLRELIELLQSHQKMTAIEPTKADRFRDERPRMRPIYVEPEPIRPRLSEPKPNMKASIEVRPKHKNRDHRMPEINSRSFHEESRDSRRRIEPGVEYMMRETDQTARHIHRQPQPRVPKHPIRNEHSVNAHPSWPVQINHPNGCNSQQPQTAKTTGKESTTPILSKPRPAVSIFLDSGAVPKSNTAPLTTAKIDSKSTDSQKSNTIAVQKDKQSTTTQTILTTTETTDKFIEGVISEVKRDIDLKDALEELVKI